MASCYILYSAGLDTYYVGACEGSVSDRLERHNAGTYGSHRFTARSSDWVVYLSMAALDYAHAIRLERKIKSMKSRVYIENLKKYAELREKIYLETSMG